MAVRLNLSSATRGTKTNVRPSALCEIVPFSSNPRSSVWTVLCAIGSDSLIASVISLRRRPPLVPNHLHDEQLHPAQFCRRHVAFSR